MAEKPTVYEKCIEVGDKLAYADVIYIVTEVYNSDRQLNIIWNLSVTPTAATAVQNPSVWQNQGTAKRDQLQRTEVQATQSRISANPNTALEHHHHTQRTAQPSILNATFVGRRDTLRMASSSWREKKTWENWRAQGKQSLQKSINWGHKQQ